MPGTALGTGTNTFILILFSTFFLTHCITHMPPPPPLRSTEAKTYPTVLGVLHVRICVCGYFRGRAERVSGGWAVESSYTGLMQGDIGSIQGGI